MQSFFFEGEINKNNSVQKVIPPMNNKNTNPFFQYVNNNKSTNPLSLPTVNQGQTNKINDFLQLSNKQGQRKNSDVLSDPRKPPSINQVSLHPPKFTQEPKKLSNETLSQNDDLKQRRSRSRDKRSSKNRDYSQQNNIKQKKEEHFHKTKLCPLYEKGECKKGAQCHFAHGFKQLRGLPNFFKTRLCLSFEKGECKKPSSQCKYAHGQSQLRDLKHDAGYSNTVSQMNKDGKTKSNNDKRDFYDDKKKKYDRDNRDNKNDRKEKDRRDRKQQFSHRKDKNRKESYHKDESHDRKKKHQKVGQNPLSYKKHIPLNKQYEKFLYNNSGIETPQPQSNSYVKYEDSMYMIPSGYVPPSTPTYKQDVYGFIPQKQTQKINTIPYSPLGQQQNYPPYNAKTYKQFSNTPSNNFADQQSNLKPYYENSVYKQPQRIYNYPNPQEKFSQRNFTPQNSFTAPNIQPYGSYKNEYPPFYQPSNEFVSQFPKDSYQGFGNKLPDHQTYRNENSQKVFSKDIGFSNDSIYSQGQRTLSSGGPILDKQPQTFYKNDSFYSPSSMKKNEINFLPPSQPATNYQTNYSNNAVYDFYPALDNSVNTNGQKYPYPYEKSRYSSSFSNNGQK